MNELIQIKDNSNLLRDSNTNSILNSNKSEYENYLRLRSKKQSEKERIKSIETEVNQIKSDISEIKNLIKSFIEKC
jgi:hypothetical protein